MRVRLGLASGRAPWSERNRQASKADRVLCDALRASAARVAAVEDLEIRELRYFAAVAEELHFGRAATRLRISQPALSRAVQRLERRLGAELLRRDRRGVRTTPAGEVLLVQARNVFDAATAAVERTRRTVPADDPLVLVTKAGASHELLRTLLDACAAQAGAPRVDVLFCEVGEQRQALLQGRADAALVHSPYDVLGGFETRALMTERQVAIVPRRHPLARCQGLTLADVADVPDLPIARWPRLDGSYPPGPGPEVHSQSEIAQLISLGRALIVIPVSSRAWQWPDHVAVPVLDAPLVTTLLAWPGSAPARGLAGLLRAADEVAGRSSADWTDVAGLPTR